MPIQWNFPIRPLLAGFHFLNYDALYSILCVSVDLTFVYSLGMFIIWLVFAGSLWWYLLLLHSPKVLPYFYYSEFCHSYYSSPILFQTLSIHQWPWIVPIRAFYSSNCLNLYCLTWFVGLCPDLMSHSQCDLTGKMTVFDYFLLRWHNRNITDLDPVLIELWILKQTINEACASE